MAAAGLDLLSQETETRLLAAMLPRVRRTFVDVGAEQGGFAQFLVHHGLSGTLFEPLPKHEAALRSLAGATGVKYFPFAVDQADGKAEFHIACDEAGQPLNYFHSLQRLNNDARVHHSQVVPVVCRSLGSLHAEGLVDSHLGVLKIDTEGNDLRVLRGLGPVRADVLICEFFTSGIYNGWLEAEPGGLIQEARKLGYEQWLAVRRRGEAELVSLNTLVFTEKEWGNLIFMAAPVFAGAWPELGAVIASVEQRLFSKLEGVPPPPKPRRWRPW